MPQRSTFGTSLKCCRNAATFLFSRIHAGLKGSVKKISGTLREWLFRTVLLTCSLGICEVAANYCTDYLRKKGVYYNVPNLANYPKYLEERDYDLGWPTKGRLSRFHDSSGSRPVPAFPDTSTTCVSLYGDSFTWSDQVEDAEAWSNVLSTMIGCRASNFGVSGYGTDQMLLRFKKNTQDNAHVVFLNHFSGDIRRNVNRMRNLMAESDSEFIQLKPRFILDDGSLKLIPLYEPRIDQLKEFLTSPERFLDFEYFLPESGNSGILRRKFPHLISLIRAFGNEHVQAKLTGESVWSRFYDKSHPSGALDITAAIMKEFARLAKARGKVPVVTFIPNVHDVEDFRKTGTWSYQPLEEIIRSSGILTHNFGPDIEAYIANRDPCEITAESCYGHYNREGYSIIGKSAARYLKDMGLISDPPARASS